MTENGRTNVVVAGGGVAAIEAMLALRDIAGDRVSITLVAPQDDFNYRPLSVGEPFALGQALSIPLATVARDVGADLRHGALASVDVDAHAARLESGETLSYDALLVAVGARRIPALQHAKTFRGQEDSESVHGADPGHRGRLLPPDRVRRALRSRMGLAALRACADGRAARVRVVAVRTSS